MIPKMTRFIYFIYLFISRIFYKDSYFNKNAVINAGPWKKKKIQIQNIKYEKRKEKKRKIQNIKLK